VAQLKEYTQLEAQLSPEQQLRRQQLNLIKQSRKLLKELPWHMPMR
jgi:hypothetical protein